MASSKSFCKRRNELAEALIENAIKLSIAASEMANVSGESVQPAFINAKSEVERLRDESEGLKAELAQHRMKHGC
jgi:hypothetical protein